MTIAIWIIVIVETIRTFCCDTQYEQLKLIKSDADSKDRACEEFIKWLKAPNKEFAKRMIEEWQRQYAEVEQ